MRLAVPGRHMALNALGALLAAVEAGADADTVLDGLAAFEGVRRRLESVGTAAGVRVFDVYAHHPTEVRVDLEALQAVAGDGRCIAVFQPHLYSRTQTFAREFGQALSLADEVFVLDVYAAREQPIAGSAEPAWPSTSAFPSGTSPTSRPWPVWWRAPRAPGTSWSRWVRAT